MIFKGTMSTRNIFIIELVLIIFFSFFPLLLELPYRSTIYLTWEGAYRMYSGQMPFRDFGMPMGYGFWIIPFAFFKLFGPYMFTLVIAQAMINLTFFIVLKKILKLFNFSAMQSLLTLLVFSLSYVLINFWPWYNHTVFFYEIIGLYFLLHYILKSPKVIFIILSSFFIGLTFFTKQDTGGLALVLSLSLLFINAVIEKSIKPILLFIGFYTLTLGLFILPLLSYDFSYWFNYGQAPHFSRINLYDFANAFFEESLWLKFYIISNIIIAIQYFSKLNYSFKSDKTYLLFVIFTLGILMQAMIIQVTTYSPPTSNIYYHAFGMAFIIFNLGKTVEFEKVSTAMMVIFLICFWQSQNYWKYSLKLMGKLWPSVMTPPSSNVVSMNTWSTMADSIKSKPVEWRTNKYRTLNRIKLPLETIKGLERVEALPQVKNNKSLTCLNMTNLTSLAYELNYPLATGKDYPLWFHKGVILFDKETRLLCENIERKEYDLILFEVQPNIDGFFSFDVRTCAQKQYKLVDTFIAPTGYTNHYIEVYIKKTEGLNSYE